jgi:GAF domain-containing protein
MVDIDPDARVTSLRRLHEAHDDDVMPVLENTIGVCVELFGVTGSGLMIIDQEHSLRDVVSSDGPGRVLERVQCETGQGPCVDTFVHDIPVTTPDIAAESRWPASRATIAEHGVRAVLGVPVHVAGVVVGSLDVYLNHPHHWTEAQRSALARYRTIVDATLRSAMAARAATELAQQLQYALDHRVVIERANGFLMASERVDAVTAFNLLRQSARNRRRKVVDIASEMLQTGTFPS